MTKEEFKECFAGLSKWLNPEQMNYICEELEKHYSDLPLDAQYSFTDENIRTQYYLAHELRYTNLAGFLRREIQYVGKLPEYFYLYLLENTKYLHSCSAWVRRRISDDLIRKFPSSKLINILYMLNTDYYSRRELIKHDLADNDLYKKVLRSNKFGLLFQVLQKSNLNDELKAKFINKLCTHDRAAELWVQKKLTAEIVEEIDARLMIKDIIE